MDTLEILMRARILLDDPDHWGRGAHESGGKFCVRGAIAHVSGTEKWHEPEAVLKVLRPLLPKNCMESVLVFNDCQPTTHRDVLALFDRAIEAEWRKVGTAEPNRPELVSA